MYLIEILLPLADNEGTPFPASDFQHLSEELAERFGGVTAFSRSPAEGLWKDGSEASRDEIVIFEVMSEHLNRDWWRSYRADLERRFRQDTIIIRAQTIERI